MSDRLLAKSWLFACFTAGCWHPCPGPAPWEVLYEGKTGSPSTRGLGFSEVLVFIPETLQKWKILRWNSNSHVWNRSHLELASHNTLWDWRLGRKNLGLRVKSHLRYTVPTAAGSCCTYWEQRAPVLGQWWSTELLSGGPCPLLWGKLGPIWGPSSWQHCVPNRWHSFRTEWTFSAP